MEFEQYLERDILTFLDSKIDKKENTSIDREEEYGLYLTKDYLKELNYALDNDELTRAKKLFDELKTNYSRLPKSSVERKKIYSLLEKMYDKIQNYVRIKEGKIEVIKQGDLEVFKDTTEKFSSITDRMEKDSSIATGITLEDIKTNPKISEPLKRTELPIGLDTDGKSKDNPFHDKKKHIDKNSIAVEANISGSTIKDQLEKPKTKENEYIEKEAAKLDTKIDYENPRQQSSPSHMHRNHKSHDENHDTTNTNPVDWKNEIIDRTAIHLERLRMHVTDKLLEELRRKLDENNDKQNQKIESLRKEIVKQVIEELDKTFKKEKSEASDKIEHLRTEILDKVYHQAQHIISSKDIQDNVNNIVVENYDVNDNKQGDRLHKDIIRIPALNSSEKSLKHSININRNTVVKISRDESLDKFENEVRTHEIMASKYSGYELRIIYEQAIYYMFDNKYSEAAKLFRKIITVQPNNKAAHIRLQECIEKQPELFKDREIMPDFEFKTIIKPLNTDINRTESLDTSVSTDINGENVSIIDDTDAEKDIAADIDNFKDEMTERVDTFSDDIKKLQKYDIRHKYNDEELQRMYEEAVYTMFQSNYEEAARIFSEILKIRPENKAARIRLQECKEATNNA